MREFTKISGGKLFRHSRNHEDDEAILAPWQSFFAWHPVKVGKFKYVWLTTVYRRWAIYTLKGGQSWEYGTIFDMLRDN